MISSMCIICIVYINILAVHPYNVRNAGVTDEALDRSHEISKLRRFSRKLVDRTILNEELSDNHGNIPTSVPTSTPTSNPSAVPTSNPTLVPTSVPTGIPTNVPSILSTPFSTKPSYTPSDVASTSPTGNTSPSYPSSIPSIATSVIPSAYSTTISSTNPVIYSSSMPSMTPSFDPSSPSTIPSYEPSSSPVPSLTLSLYPSSEPHTDSPTVPSNYPITSPISFPSGTYSPTSIQNYTQTNQPTKVPSPSSSPFESPTIKSLEPTKDLSRSPIFTTSNPSVCPSTSSSSAPSATGSTAPSLLPSTTPSSIPTFKRKEPTINPTFSPTRHPTFRPTLKKGETASPTISFQPSSSPTNLPAIITLTNKQSMDISLADFLSDSRTGDAFCDSITSIVSGASASGLNDLGCSITSVKETVTTSNIRIISSSILINYVISFSAPSSSSSDPSNSFTFDASKLANATATALRTSVESGLFNSQWKNQLSLYGVSNNAILSATSFSISTDASVVIPTFPPTVRPSRQPSAKPSLVPTVNATSSILEGKEANDNISVKSGPFRLVWIAAGLIVFGAIVIVLYYVRLEYLRNLVNSRTQLIASKLKLSDNMSKNPTKGRRKTVPIGNGEKFEYDDTEEGDMRRMSLQPDDINNQRRYSGFQNMGLQKIFEANHNDYVVPEDAKSQSSHESKSSYSKGYNSKFGDEMNDEENNLDNAVVSKITTKPVKNTSNARDSAITIPDNSNIA